MRSPTSTFPFPISLVRPTDQLVWPAVPSVVTAAQESIAKEVAAIQTLAATAGKYPYYRFNYAWTRTVQDAVSLPRQTLAR